MRRACTEKSETVTGDELVYVASMSVTSSEAADLLKAKVTLRPSFSHATIVGKEGSACPAYHQRPLGQPKDE